MDTAVTRHAQARMQQRAIRPEALDCLMAFGREAFDHRGGVVLYFDKAARRRLAGHGSAVLWLTGLSGAGKSSALRALEDIEYYCVDNLPLPFMTELVEALARDGQADKLAVAIDSRQRRYLPTWGAELAKLRGAGHRLEVMFLDAKDDVLLRRFSETRRRHPLSGDEVSEGIRRDRELLAELRVGAAVVDTSNLTTHQFKAIIQDRYGGTGKLEEGGTRKGHAVNATSNSGAAPLTSARRPFTVTSGGWASPEIVRPLARSPPFWSGFSAWSISTSRDHGRYSRRSSPTLPSGLKLAPSFVVSVQACGSGNGL